MPPDRQSKREKRNRRRRRLGALQMLLSILIIAAAISFGITIFFRVSSITVEGARKYTEDQVKEASGIELGSNLVMLNKTQTAGVIMESLPYVSKVIISRILPGSVVIRIDESRPIAVILSDYSDYWLLDKSGKLLERVNEETASQYMQIIGVKLLAPTAGKKITLSEAQKDRQTVIPQLLTAIDDNGLTEHIVSVNVDKSYDLKLQYEQMYSVELGDISEIDYKIKYLVTIIPKLEETNPGKQGVIDLTFTDEKVARFRPEQEMS